MAERITYTTDDDVIIVGDWYPTPTVLGAVLLLHMMPETRTSWALLARELAKKNIASLAIDLRGHGESTSSTGGAKLDYQKFEDVEHQASEYDVIGAIDWLRTRNLELPHIAVGGASIGADLALQALVDEPRLPGAFLISPGEYRGFKPADMIGDVLPHQSLYIVSSEDDDQSFATSKQVYDASMSTQKTFVPYKTGGHGTALFATDKTLMSKIADWTARIVRG